MKKVFNNSIFMFILGVLVTVCFGVGVYAINANEIDYKNDKKVSDALDDLYTEVNLPLIDRIDGTSIVNSYDGDKIMGSSASINLSAGSYLVFGVESMTSPVSTNQESTSSGTTPHPTITYASGSCTSIASRRSVVVPTATYSSLYIRGYLYYNIWKCSFDTDTIVTITDSVVGGNNNSHPLSVIAQAIKVD